jgi:glutamate synthase (NADPH/NADH) small chain
MVSVPARRSGKRVAVIGSGPAGLACAQQLARAGHSVRCSRRATASAVCLRYGIPDFKMEKWLIDRRVEQMEVEGVVFRAAIEVGVDVDIGSLVEEFDALAMTGGAEAPRDLEVAGRELDGIHFAMDFLPQQNKRNAGDAEERAAPHGTITAEDRHVVVIGGGDTGSDCIGTSVRQGAASITQLEILPKPPERENKALVWPDWPMKLRTSSSHDKGCERDWSVLTKRAICRRRPPRCARMRARRVGQRHRWPVCNAGGSGDHIHLAGRSGSAGYGISRSPEARHGRAVGCGARPPRQCQLQHRRLSHFGGESVRRR